MRAFIDLGSECVTLRKTEADELQLDVQPTETTLRGYGGGTVQPYGITKALLKVDLVEAPVDIHVVPNDPQDVPLIIGQPFTDLPNVTVVQKGGDLRIFEASAVALQEMEELPPRKLTLSAAEATVIPANHAANVRIVVKDNLYQGDMFVDLSVRGKGNSEHCVPRCIINTSLGLLPIVNLSEVPLHMKQNQVVTRAWVAREETRQEKVKRRVLAIRKSTLGELPIDQIIINENVTDTDRADLVALLNRYRDCFALSTNELGNTNEAEIDIELTGGAPVVYRPYRLSYSDRLKVREIVDDLKANHIIRDSNSPFASPILLVRKKNGGQNVRRL